MVAFRVRVASADEETAASLLWEHGTAGVEVTTDGGESVLVAYFEDAPELDERLRSSFEAVPNARLEPWPVPEVDWVRRFREGFRPFGAGRFRIVPSWDEAALGSDGRVLVVDPGRAFGTGTHESTRLCLAAIETLAARRPLGRVLDLGAGTGLLAVAASRLGARAVVAADLDPEAVDSARLHASLNRVALSVVRGDGGRPFRAGSFDLVLANLTAPLLLERRREIAELAAPAATLVLSGFLDGDLAEIRSGYASSGSAEAVRDGEWAALVVRLP